jgi:hypothetical protein
MKFSDVKTIETTDGLYVNLNDLADLIAKVRNTFPSFTLWYLNNLLKESINEKT